MSHWQQRETDRIETKMRIQNKHATEDQVIKRKVSPYRQDGTPDTRKLKFENATMKSQSLYDGETTHINQMSCNLNKENEPSQNSNNFTHIGASESDLHRDSSYGFLQ